MRRRGNTRITAKQPAIDTLKNLRLWPVKVLQYTVLWLGKVLHLTSNVRSKRWVGPNCFSNFTNQRHKIQVCPIMFVALFDYKCIILLNTLTMKISTTEFLIQMVHLILFIILPLKLGPYLLNIYFR